MEEFMKNIAVFLPLLIIELTLGITACIHVLRHRNYKFGNRIMWVLIVLFIQIIGPIVYFVFGRGEDEWKS